MTSPRHWHRGERASRRLGRQRRNWTIAAVAGVTVLLIGGSVAAAAMLGGDDDSSVSAPVAKRSKPHSRTSRATTPGTVPTRACRTGLTPDAPLRLWIAGDSIAYSVGNGLGKRAANTGVVAPVYESRVSSGLASPGFFDWPRRVGEELPRLDPEIVVFVMGTNDWVVPQATPTDATGRPAWKAIYERQVQTMVDALTADDRTLYWVGPPVLRDAKQEAGARDVAAVIEEVVERHPNGVFVDTHDLLDADDGSYTAALDVDGKRLQVRTGDGVHLTMDGADYLGDALFARIDEQCRLKDQAVAGERQALVETKGSTSVAPGATATAPPTTPPTVPQTVAATAPPTTAPPANTPTTPTTQTTEPTPATSTPTTSVTTGS